jgi:hypothetical protein
MATKEPLRAPPAALRQLRSDDGVVNETGASARQFDLLAAERQLTLDGREEPLVAAPAALPVGSKGEEDNRTLPLPLPGVGQQLELREPKWMKACAAKSWHLHLKNKKTGKEERICWTCRSWRHQGDCARQVARKDFARISEAFGREKPESLVYLVLTLDQGKDESHGMTPISAYRSLVRRWQSLRQWLQRQFGQVGYVATVEQHRTGWPHLNLVVSCVDFAAAIRAEDRKNGIAPSWLKGAAVRAGFGYRAWAEAPRDHQELAGYLVKLAHKESLLGEVAKLSQLPLASPPGTRRLRSSRAFLPPSTTSTGEWTGELLKYSVAAAENLEVERERRSAEAWAGAEEWLRDEARRLLGAPQRDPKGAEGAAQPASGEGGATAGSGAEPRLVTTGTSSSATLVAGHNPLPPRALPGVDPPGGGSSALSCTVSSGPNAGAA